MATAHLLLSPRGPGLDPQLLLPLPAGDIVSTTLHVGSTSELPILLSVERVVGNLSQLGLALRSPSEAEKIAALISKTFFPVPVTDWTDAPLELDVVPVSTPEDLEALRAVSALRPPVLHAAETALENGSDYVPVRRRALENRLVNSLEAAVESRRAIWLKYGLVLSRYLGATVLEALVEHLIGIPLADIVRTTVSGALRTIT